LKTLAQYQRVSGGVVFGVNLIPLNEGTLDVEAPIEVLEEVEPGVAAID
jgi:uncharacterized protein YcbX